MGGYCASGKPFVLVVISWPGLLNIFDNLNVIVNIIGQLNECLSFEKKHLKKPPKTNSQALTMNAHRHWLAVYQRHKPGSEVALPNPSLHIIDFHKYKGQ